ncbi:hypothetical protein [Streptomyces specialis]|uniref:hypothetical protein n=1 Tax=Streptomyces specialis TaxID=498367 RepID=UPI00073F184E|nr:hypothetical protein [Streptomyces specialis]
MLLPGITLSVLSDLFGPSDIMISSGVRPLPGPAAAESALVPRDDWRPLTDDEFAVLSPGAPVPLYDRMTLVDLDPGDLERSQRRLLPLLAGASESREPTGPAEPRKAAIREVCDRLLATLARRGGITCETVGPADAVVHRPGRLSTAYNYDRRFFMGLHLDNHQDHALTERHLAYPLTVVNLGFADRYVHFVNLRVTALCAMLREAGHGIPATTHALKNAFFAAHPSCPVLRVRLRPGQAYLVNTQDVLHDGATNDRGLPDVSLLSANALSVAEPSPAR